MRTVQEEDEEQQSHEALNEPLQQLPNLRKASLMSEDSDIFIPDKTYSTTTVPASVPVETKPPYLNIQTRQETTSTESKDTLTPIEPSEAQAADEDEDASTENIMELNFEVQRQKALRGRSMGRRLSSECCSNYDLNRSQTSLNAALAMSRRQLSLTQSEPDSGNELPGNFSLSRFLFVQNQRKKQSSQQRCD